MQLLSTIPSKNKVMGLRSRRRRLAGLSPPPPNDMESNVNTSNSISDQLANSTSTLSYLNSTFSFFLLLGTICVQFYVYYRLYTQFHLNNTYTMASVVILTTCLDSILIVKMLHEKKSVLVVFLLLHLSIWYLSPTGSLWKSCPPVTAVYGVLVSVSIEGMAWIQQSNKDAQQQLLMSLKQK